MLLRLNFILSMLISYVACQRFNTFKSYKDAAVKPANYGKVIQKDHPITEYLDSKQLKMLQERTGPVTPDNSFDNSWSGFKDKSVLAELKKKRGGGGGRGRKGKRKQKAAANADTVDDDSTKGGESQDRRLSSLTSSISPADSFLHRLPVLLEGNVNQNLFYLVLFGFILGGMSFLTLYYLYKNVAALWGASKKPSAAPINSSLSSTSFSSFSTPNNSKRMKCDKDGVCQLDV